MKRNMNSSEGLARGRSGISGRGATWAVVCKALQFSMIGVISVMAASANPSQDDNPGKIVFTDSSAAVLIADIATATPAVVATGQRLMQPFGIAVGQNGELFVSDTGCLGLVGIQPET